MAAEVKPRNNRLLMVLGIVVAVVAFLIVVLFFGKGGGDATAGRTQDVVVAAVDIPAGQQVSDALVHIVKFAPDQVPAGAQTTTKEAVGQFALVALPKNSVLTGSNLGSTVGKVPQAKKPYLDIPSGQVAMAIPAGGELQAVAGYLQQDDRVDILFNPAVTTKDLWKVTYQNLRIARLGGPSAAASSSGSSSAAPAAASSIVVYVSLDDAEQLSVLFSSGNYKLVLRAQADASKNDVVTTQGATTDSLAAKFNIAK